MIEVPILSGLTVKLRRPKEGDVGARLALGRSPEIVHMFGGDPKDDSPLEESDAKEWVDRLVNHPCAWVIEHDNNLLGEIRLDGLDTSDRRARLAIGLLDPAKLGKGLGREAVHLVLEHAFDILGLHRVALRVVSYNIRAIRCYSACGFLEEGREREAAFVAGEWHDDVMMGLLDREFARHREDKHAAHNS